VERNLVDPLILLAIYLLVGGGGLWWFDWRDRRDGIQKTRNKSD
jgi:hypothetical protein